MTPPEPIVGHTEVEVRSPQIDPALSRIQSPMPFPRTLVATLSHAASFVDQAGYLAKYAVDRYDSLDKAYHTLNEQAAELNKQIGELSEKHHEDTEIIKAEKEKSLGLEKKLSEAQGAAAKREAELTQQIQDLRKTLAKDQAHDAADHEALEAAHKSIQEEQAAKNDLKKALSQSESDLAAVKATAKQLSTKNSDLTAKVSDLKGQLDVEREHNAELQKVKSELEEKLKVSEKNLLAAQKTLARSQEDLAQARSESDDKDKIIEGLENGMMAIKKDRDAKKKAFQELKLTTDATIKDLEDQLATAISKGGASWQPPAGTLYPSKDSVPAPLQGSIDKHQSKSSWARLSVWIGNMSNRGRFFNSLDDVAGESDKLTSIAFHINSDWICGLTLQWNNGKMSHSYGITNASPAVTIQQSEDKPIVAMSAVTDDSSPRSSPYQPVVNVTLFGFDKGNAGYGQIGECAAPHNFGRWTKAVAQTSLAPAMDGSWSLRGVYGYYDGSLDAIGFVWAKN